MERKRNSWISDSLIVCILGLFTISCCKKENPFIEIPEVTTGEIKDITDNTAVCGGFISSDGGSEMTISGVCWSTDSTSLYIEKAQHIEDLHDTGSFASSITNLTPNTTFFVKAYASNKIGTGYGKTISFTTVGSYVTQINFNESIEYGKLIDQDGNTYKTVNIGTQVWMAENLKAITYSDRKSISLGYDYYWYNNYVNANKATYGALYSWIAVNTEKLCPVGWHVPTSGEWEILSNSLGGLTVAGGKLKEMGTVHWKSPNSGAANSSGFTALPGGILGRDPSGFNYLGSNCYFWSSTWYHKEAHGGTPGISFQIRIKIDFDSESFNSIYSGYFSHGSVRCIKN